MRIVHTIGRIMLLVATVHLVVWYHDWIFSDPLCFLVAVPLPFALFLVYDKFSLPFVFFFLFFFFVSYFLFFFAVSFLFSSPISTTTTTTTTAATTTTTTTTTNNPHIACF